ncbi:MAG: YabP/YqfC family sporulation protein [Clostridia bacterium]|nr:YabP/YqfC family sporulation protein [Clostridia bacterium]
MEKGTRAAPDRKNHTLSLENRHKAHLTGVSEVLGFDENQVSLLTDHGEIALTGEGLHVTKLMLEEGQLAVEGKIDAIAYTQRARRRGLFRRDTP